jgi:hypothetical protein
MAATTSLGVILLHLMLRPRCSELAVTDQQEDIERQRQRFIGVLKAISSPEGMAQRASPSVPFLYPLVRPPLTRGHSLRSVMPCDPFLDRGIP